MSTGMVSHVFANRILSLIKATSVDIDQQNLKWSFSSLISPSGPLSFPIRPQ